MKLSVGFWQTHKEIPSDAEIASHQLAIRAGLIQKSAGGLYSFLPLGLKVLKKIENIIRDEHDKASCYEIEMPVVTPGELWEESGRWDVMGPLMLKAKDRAGRNLCISPTNEEAVVDIFRKSIKSYKQLPVTLYQINTKFRDEIRPRYGLLRCREFLMKDAYSFHADWASLDQTYDKMFQVYSRIISRMGLKFIAVEADGGAMADGKAKTHEFQVLAPSGEDRVIHCISCGYAANVEKAETKRAVTLASESAPLLKVHTPSQMVIADVSKFLQVEEARCLKSVVYSSIKGDEERLILCLLHGDDQLNEVKLSALLGCDHLIPATSAHLEAYGIPAGFIGPVGLSEKVRVIFDDTVNLNAPYVSGAMEKDYHFKNYVPQRDTKIPYEVVSLREARAGDFCGKCSSVVEEIKGIEVGHIFQLGNKYTKKMGVTVLDTTGIGIIPVMGCYGIGVSRMIAATIEQHHDEFGIVWPKAIAPYQLYFVVISKDSEINALADSLYEDMKQAGIEVLYDDRTQSPGIKFKDADLLGLPLQITLGERDYKVDQMMEIKVRRSGEKRKVNRENCIGAIKELLATLP